MRALPLSMVAAAMLAAACESKQKPAVPPPPPPPAVVTIHAMDYSFQAPLQIASGVTTFHLVNDGPGLHHALLVRLFNGKMLTDLLGWLKSSEELPSWAMYVGGPNVPDSGKESVATLDLAAGDYVLICILDMPGGVPHYRRGMYRAMTVTEAPAATPATPAAVLPPTDNTIALSDYVFALGQPITAGTHSFRVVTAPGQPHEVLFVQLDPGKTGADYMKWVPSMRGPPPGHAIGGTAAAAAGVTQTFVATFAPGEYLLVSLVPDARDGKPQYVHGMMQTVKVN